MCRAHYSGPGLVEIKPYKERLKPNGRPNGTFVISIDDGYVEYSYDLRLRSEKYSIDYEKIFFNVRDKDGRLHESSFIRMNFESDTLSFGSLAPKDLNIHPYPAIIHVGIISVQLTTKRRQCYEDHRF